mmetsp:Transcript_6120/g.8557  ORF Transcript_6120/g.8557 Transcript_6120/m.8557 type:complete len:127 (+) Transcript_6120:333-713(+)
MGIEILPGLYEIALQMKEKFEKVTSNFHLERRDRPVVDFLLGSFLSDLQWLDGDVIFANSTCFEAATMSRLHELAAKGMKKGAVFVTLSRPLLSAESRSEPFEVVWEGRQKMSWGGADCFLHLKTR